MGRRHVIAVLESGAIRVTSPVTSLNPQARSITTSSGRIYELQGAPEQDEVFLTVFAKRASNCGLAEGVDISSCIWEKMRSATH